MDDSLVEIAPGISYSALYEVIFVEAHKVLAAAGLPVTQETMLACFQGIESNVARLAHTFNVPVEGTVLVQQDGPSMLDLINQLEEKRNGKTGNEH